MPLLKVNVHDSTIRKRVDKIAIHGRVSEICFIFWKLYVTSDMKLTKNFIKITSHQQLNMVVVV